MSVNANDLDFLSWKVEQELKSPKEPGSILVIHKRVFYSNPERALIIRKMCIDMRVGIDCLNYNILLFNAGIVLYNVGNILIQA